MHRMIMGITLATSVWATGAWECRAETLTLGASQDVNIAGGGLANLNLLTPSSELLINWSGVASSRGLIQFDLGTLPAGAVIQGATLSLFHLYNDGDGQTYDLLLNTSAWDESTVTYNTAPAFETSPVSSLTIGDQDALVRREWDVTSVVQSWFDGTEANFGLTLKRSVEMAAGYIYLASSRSDSPAQRPELVITYTRAAVPEPASVTIMGLGIVGLAGLHVRRRIATA